MRRNETESRNLMPVRIAPDAAAVVIDAGSLSTRIGLAGSETFTNGPALPQALMETALHALCEQAAIDLSCRPVCVTESTVQRYGPRESRERWVTLLFECFNVHSMYSYLLLQPVCGLFKTGLTTGKARRAYRCVTVTEWCYCGGALKNRKISSFSKLFPNSARKLAICWSEFSPEAAALAPVARAAAAVIRGSHRTCRHTSRFVCATTLAARSTIRACTPLSPRLTHSVGRSHTGGKGNLGIGIGQLRLG